MRKVLILAGDGINAEIELARAFREQGGSVTTMLVNELLMNPERLRSYDLLALPGGFSFGDELRSGKILAEKMRHFLNDHIEKFLEKEARILGICNGFQVLAQWGLLGNSQRSFTLTHNHNGQFINKWVSLRVDSSCPWFHKLGERIYLPIRHGEGKIVLSNHSHPPRGVLWYEKDVNGSWDNTAGVMSANGKVFGLMPHPEVATKDFLHPFRLGSRENSEQIQQFFKNCLT
jgi:phosphoribosylformylglycinamidine synthase